MTLPLGTVSLSSSSRTSAYSHFTSCRVQTQRDQQDEYQGHQVSFHLHAKPSITLDLYGHLYHEMLGEAAKIMDDLVTPIKLDMSEFETHDAGKGRDEVHFSE